MTAAEPSVLLPWEYVSYYLPASLEEFYYNEGVAYNQGVAVRPKPFPSISTAACERWILATELCLREVVRLVEHC
jgi:hypothetical protein